MDRPERARIIRPSWMRRPFAAQLFALLVVALFVPAFSAIWLLKRGTFTYGAGLLLGWSILFCALAVLLHNRHVMRIWISMPSALLVLALFWRVLQVRQ